VFTIDKNWQITSFNRAAEVITGYTAQEAIGLYCRDIFKSVTCLETCPLRRTLATGEPVYDAEVEITAKEGRQIPITVNTALLYEVDGTVIGGVETFRDLSNVKALTEELEGRYSFHNIIGKAKPMQALYDLLEDVAETDATVLIQGASGTGKELVARAIHYNGPRREQPFIPVNCAALPESLLESELFGYERGAFTGAVRDKPGRFERAEGGTLFLDEIGEMSPAIQAKLLRVLDSGEMERVGGTQVLHTDVRVITATNRDLLEAVEQGTFREDLYYRLNVISIRLPTLYERKEDIPLLTDHFIRIFNAKTGRSIRGLSRGAMRYLLDYNWPGNVRELENAIEYGFVRCEGEHILPGDLPEALHPSIDQEHLLEEKDPFGASERALIRTTLEKVGGNRGSAAKILGISRPTLWRKMKKYGLL
jgi:PAS domain S-box-containing protein